MSQNRYFATKRIKEKGEGSTNIEISTFIELQSLSLFLLLIINFYSSVDNFYIIFDIFSNIIFKLQF